MGLLIKYLRISLIITSILIILFGVLGFVYGNIEFNSDDAWFFFSHGFLGGHLVSVSLFIISYGALGFYSTVKKRQKFACDFYWFGMCSVFFTYIFLHTSSLSWWRHETITKYDIISFILKFRTLHYFKWIIISSFVYNAKETHWQLLSCKILSTLYKEILSKQM